MTGSDTVQFVVATKQHLLEVKSWFNSPAEIYTWGGPNMAYPMADEGFLALLQAQHLSSYSLLNDEQQLLAFGQHYIRLGRHHLGRLAVNPDARGRGLAKVLIKQLLSAAQNTENAKGASLFVFADNNVALQCYQSLGFKIVAYPDTMPGNMQNCLYMVLDY